MKYFIVIDNIMTIMNNIGGKFQDARSQLGRRCISLSSHFEILYIVDLCMEFSTIIVYLITLFATTMRYSVLKLVDS